MPLIVIKIFPCISSTQRHKKKKRKEEVRNKKDKKQKKKIKLFLLLAHLRRRRHKKKKRKEEERNKKDKKQKKKTKLFLLLAHLPRRRTRRRERTKKKEEDKKKGKEEKRVLSPSPSTKAEDKKKRKDEELDEEDTKKGKNKKPALSSPPEKDKKKRKEEEPSNDDTKKKKEEITVLSPPKEEGKKRKEDKKKGKNEHRVLSPPKEKDKEKKKEEVLNKDDKKKGKDEKVILSPPPPIKAAVENKRSKEEEPKKDAKKTEEEPRVTSPPPPTNEEEDTKKGKNEKLALSSPPEKDKKKRKEEEPSKEDKKKKKEETTFLSPPKEEGKKKRKEDKKKGKNEHRVLSPPKEKDKEKKKEEVLNKGDKKMGNDEKVILSPPPPIKAEAENKRSKEEEPKKDDKKMEEEPRVTSPPPPTNEEEDKKKREEEESNKDDKETEKENLVLPPLTPTDEEQDKTKKKEEELNKDDKETEKDKNEETNQTINDLLPKYDAFISFRGTDVRQTFVSHLFAHMNNERHILTFKDDVSLRGGDVVSPSLVEAIERSLSYVVIFSPNYATSGWCLDELVQIVKCARERGRKIIPVFYGGVTPSIVRHKKEGYKKAFAEHENKLPHDKETAAKIGRWRTALTEAANISGFESTVVTPERRLVEEVTKSVLAVIRPDSSPITQGLVGIEPEIEAVETLLETDDTQPNRIIGFWGMPGIGKTTLAKAIFHKLDADKFPGRHYIQNFAGQLKKGTTVIDLQKELFNKLLGDENSHAIPFDLKLHRLRRLRSFVIIDDVSNKLDLDELLVRDSCNLFGPGSRMILTSTNQQVLKNVCQEVHKVPGLDDEKALRLFSLSAFKKDQPPIEFRQMSDKAVDYCGGNPLALRVMGLMFYDRSMGFWKGTMEKLRSLPKKEIQDLLMIFYNELSSDEQSAFLDVACFFNYDDYEFVTRVLDEDLVTNLVDKSLVGIDYTRGEIEMHALLEDLGKDIVRQKAKSLGERSRLWEAREALKLLAENPGLKETEGILLNLTEKEERIKIESAIFKRMCNLRLFGLELAPESKVVFPEEGLISSLPDELRYLQWDLFAAKSLPSEFSPQNLRVLRLKQNSILQLWEGANVDLGNLKELNLTASKYLTDLPDLSTAEKLELIDLTSCNKLTHLPNSITHLPCLKTLTLDSCKALDLSNLDEDGAAAAFPSLEQANLNATPVKEVPLSVLRAPKLTKLDCSSCPNLTNFPSIDALVVTMSIKHLILRNNKLLVSLPDDIYKLESLQTLDLYGCEGLEEFPEIMGMMEELWVLDLSYCSKVSRVPNRSIVCLGNLERLYLSGTGIEEVSIFVLTLERLVELRLDQCKKLKWIPESFRQLSRLEELDLEGCDVLNNKEPKLPDSIKRKP